MGNLQILTHVKKKERDFAVKGPTSRELLILTTAVMASNVSDSPDNVMQNAGKNCSLHCFVLRSKICRR